MKPSLPRGTRDFGPADVQKRNYLFTVLKRHFGLYGFAPIETPAMEQLETLTGKYGDEGDQLIFKILNSRLNESSEKNQVAGAFNEMLEAGKSSKLLTERALRYDLTVPFARFVVMNQHQLVFPFRRYQIQPVWRADKPQKGRYREFWQCDADIIGSESLVNELDLMALMDSAFAELQLPVTIRLNNRKILNGLAAAAGHADQLTDITVAIDKLDKIGVEGVVNELASKGISPKGIDFLTPLLRFQGNQHEKIELLRSLIGKHEVGAKGIEEITYLFENASVKHAELQFDLTLARGLNYYTGTIFEASANAGTLTSSILGGGRYDDLTGIFGLKQMSGVGISFGIDRIYDVMEELNLFPEAASKATATTLMFVHFDVAAQRHCLQLAAVLRAGGIACEVYPDAGKKTNKQFDYANKRQVPYVVTVGSDEMASAVYPLKNMQTGEQQKLTLNGILDALK
jgi:histidyl-tRNA synthetase